jgi:phosphoglycolate phosphatase
VNATRRALLFDLDGTLVDSVPDLRAAVNQALAGLGYASLSEEEVRGYVGDGARVLLARALGRSMVGHEDPALVDKAWGPFMAAYESQLCVRSQLYPGVAETLRRLHGKGYRLGVVTNKPARFVAPLLKQLGVLDCFEVCVGGDSLPHRKPDPAPLLHAMAALEATAESTTMVGDSLNDIRAGQAAGCLVIAVSYGYNHGLDLRQVGATAVIDRMDDLMDCLNRLSR